MTKPIHNTTPFFPDFQFHTLRRKPRSAQQKQQEVLAKLTSKRLDHLQEILKGFVLEDALRPPEAGLGSRERIYTMANTFYAFLQQGWSEDGSCQEAVHRIIEQAQSQGIRTIPSPSTSAYVQARARLPIEELEDILYHGAGVMEAAAATTAEMERPWIVVDGTGFSMPDTPANQEQWPQSSNQKPGLGFPVLKTVATFSLASGAILDAEIGSLHDHDLALLRRMYDGFSAGDILLGDRGFCGWLVMTELKERYVDTLVRLHGMRKVLGEKHALKSFGPGDILIEHPRPLWQAKSGVSKEELSSKPESLLLRQVSFRIEVPGFRTQEVHLVTTLLDPIKYPKELLMNMYLRRWRIEVAFKDIKCSMGWEILSCKSPGMIRREFLMMLIGYNAIRYLQQQAAQQEDLELERLSFKSSLQVVRIWEKRFRNPKETKGELRRLMLKNIASVQVPNRPDRAEPRVKKRRPKKVRFMTESRENLRKNLYKNQAA